MSNDEDRILIPAGVLLDGLRLLERGTKKVELEAYYSDAFGDKKVQVSMYWVGSVVRIDIKGLK